MSRAFSIQEGYQIVMLFLVSFWVDFFKNEMVDVGMIRETLSLSKLAGQHDGVLYKLNDYFFITVCDGNSSDYFEKVIEDTLQVPPIKQMEMPVQEENLFQLMIDFCKFVNKRFAVTMVDSLKFAIDWLEDMRKHPEQHQTEWEMWNQTVIDVTEHGARSGGLF